MSEIDSRSVVGDASEGEARIALLERELSAAVSILEGEGYPNTTRTLDGFVRETFTLLHATRAALEEARAQIAKLTRDRERWDVVESAALSLHCNYIATAQAWTATDHDLCNDIQHEHFGGTPRAAVDAFTVANAADRARRLAAIPSQESEKV